MQTHQRPDPAPPPAEQFSGNIRAFVHYIFALTVMTLYGGQV
ncbi:hypothetical protein SAMN05660653_00394 [Desulfonatronum thiosulfatophilum]|uniref:Uncharacterized protein n=1 Tax=Desulfonatronum thiosulfatophilum TaxID=617002 RepID=A0A1G6AIY8_9BACT|nr:hypothetical protein [Desulfonatronum thiosulfatophilum]SDB08372.1 hypothetical protein SAMN05660653_00394 [Desulfonatronum thiosulfatophilum]